MQQKTLFSTTEVNASIKERIENSKEGVYSTRPLMYYYCLE